MKDETKQQIQFWLSALKQTMKNEGVIFALAIDEHDFDKSRLFLWISRVLWMTTNETDFR